MTPEEQAILSAYGGDIINEKVRLIIITVGYGAFLLASFIALQFVSVLTKKSIIFVSLLLIFVTSLWTMIFQCGATLTEVKFGFIKNLNEGLVAQAQVANAKTLPWYYTANWPVTINLLLSDIIVCWRAWILFGDHRVWKIILVILMGANIGINVADLIWDNIHADIDEGYGVLDWLSAAISLSVNLLATAMIAYRAWIHYHIMAEASIAHKSRSVRLMLLLIESGTIFCFLQLLNTVVTILNATLPVEQATSKWNLSFVVITQIFIVTSALYPVVVFILIHTNNSPVVETFHFTQSRQEANNSSDILALEEVSSSPPEISNLVGGALGEDRGDSRVEST